MKKLLLFLLLAIAIISETQATGVVVTATGTNILCSGQCNASAYGFATGGVGPYGYYWAGANSFAASGQIQYNLCAGTYTVTAVDSSDMSFANYVLTIIQPAPVFSQNITNYSTCPGFCVQLNVSTTGGTPPYSYVWTPPVGLSSSTIPNPLACPTSTTTYMYSVTDANGCSGNTSYVVVNVSNALNVVATANSTTCGQCNGLAVATASGSSGGVTYSWTGPNGFMSTAPTAGNLCAGTYSVTATSTNGCSGSTTVNVGTTSGITSASIVPSPSGCANNTGSIYITNIVGGTGPYLYNINGVNYSTNLITGLAAGTYQVGIIDNSQCVYSTSAVVLSTSGLSMVIDTTHASGCNSSATGSATIHAIGGIPPYSYFWTPGGQTDASVSNLTAGTHYVQVIDSLGCIANQAVIIASGNPPTVVLDTLININCQSASTGTIAVHGSGGTAPYTYQWSNGATTSTVTGLNPGGYYVYVIDAAGCTGIHTYQIITNSNLYVATTCTFANCGNNGTANVNATGGVPPYTYSWSNGTTIGNGTSVNNLQGTTVYTVTVTDSTGCSATGMVYVYNLCYNVIKGNIYYDLNGNCVRDIGEPGANTSVTSMNGTNTTGYGYSYNNSGNYSIYTTSMNNDVSLNYLPLYTVQTCPPAPTTQPANFTTMGDTISGVDFAVQQLPNINDLRVLFFAGNARPGFLQNGYLYYYNVGTTTINNVVITLTHDSILTLNSSNPTANSYSYPTLTYNIGTLAPGQYGYVYPKFNVPLIVNGGYIGRVLHYTATINPIAGDYVPADNTYSTTRTISNSYDPNEKEVLPAGDITLADTLLHYTINFQNTGNDTAFTVVIKDTLSQYLDISSIEPGLSSYPYSFDMSFNGELTFRFDNILLVDSTTNEPASHGFVSYSVRPKSNNTVGTIISNKAYIYFDFNDAIITNTVNTLIQGATAINTISDNGTVKVFPNPSTGKFIVQNLKSNIQSLKVYNLLGEVVYQSEIKNPKSEIDITSQPKGIYFYKAYSTNGEVSNGKLIKE